MVNFFHCHLVIPSYGVYITFLVSESVPLNIEYFKTDTGSGTASDVKVLPKC